ncbi:hypothetical protein ES703_110129 [subsurface metagenome]
MMKKLELPPGFTKKSEIYIPKRYSVADWDFEYGATNRSLSAIQYISAPTALRILEPTTATFIDVILCRVPETLCLPQGEVRNWQHGYYKNLHPIVFRNQAPLGSATFFNSYHIYLVQTTAVLYRHILGVVAERDRTTCETFTDTWTHYRAVFWNGYTPESIAALCVNLYREVAGEWVQEGETMHDTDNSWADSEINRIGFAARSTYNHPQYWDDTELWAPA